MSARAGGEHDTHQHLGHDGSVAHDDEDPNVEMVNEFDEFPHNEECAAVLTMKCGEPLMAVRKKLHDEITITFIPEEGFGVFQSKVERHYAKIGPTYVQEKRGIYLKPSSNATQTKYVLLTKENFDPLLRMRWKIARSMKVDLKYEVFCYFVDTTNKKEKKRLSMKMFQQDNAAEFNGSNSSGSTPVPPQPFMGFAPGASGPHGFPLVSAQSISHAIQNYADLNSSAIDSANLPTGGSAKKNSKNSNTGKENDATASSERPRKIARLNRNNAAAAAALPVPNAAVGALDVHEEPFFQAIPFRINGFVVPLEVDITALRRCLGLSMGHQQVSSNAVDAAASTSSADIESQQQQYDRSDL
uniref:Uncharacterized protein n=1 Tax=Globisporangium ultimum (strain ATCC 200006 / CBS 805.95 / DAOM BR144) TaxID=431595 RepID=K3WA20_GLOUD